MSTYKPLTEDLLCLVPAWPDCETSVEQCRRANRLAEATQKLLRMKGHGNSVPEAEQALAAYRGDT